MEKYFAIFFIVFLCHGERALAQKNTADYYYQTKEMHGLFHLKIKPNNTFEYTIIKGLGNSYSFGRISIDGNKHLLKSKSNDFSVRLLSSIDNSITNGKLLIKPLAYRDSTFEYGAYLIIDNDTINKKYIHAEDGVLINADFKSLTIQIREDFYTRTIYKREIHGNEVMVSVDAPFQPDEFLFIVNNYYFTFSRSNQIKMFDEKGKFIFVMTKK